MKDIKLTELQKQIIELIVGEFMTCDDIAWELKNTE